MVCRQIRQWQNLYQDPIVINHGLQHLNQDVIFVHKPKAQHRPLDAQ